MKLWKNLGKVLVVAALALLAGLASRPALAKIQVDQLGRQVNVPAAPRRLVTLAASLTETVFDLGLGNRLVGVAQFSDYPPAAKKLPKVGSYIAPDLEKIVALRPDLCLAIKDGNPRQVVDRLQSLGIPVYVVDPRNLPKMIATLQEIGHLLLGAGTRADELAAKLTRRYQRIKALAALAKHRPRVFLQIGLAPIVSAGGHHHHLHGPRWRF
jgi:iron complex transport system substrate-binding protein